MRIPDHIVTIDTETTGLYVREWHMPWEVTYAIGEQEPVTLLLPHDREAADPRALAMNGYHRRWDATKVMASHDEIQAMFHTLRGKHLLGANVRFDMLMLHRWWGMHAHEDWHYRAVELESQAMLMLDLDTPPGLSTIVQMLNDQYDADIPENDHSSLGDVETTRAAYRFIREWRSTVGLTVKPN